MLKVYLDNNIIISIENGEYGIDRILKLFPSDQIQLFYSSAHIFEIQHFEGNSKISKADLLAKRFETIRRLFANNYLYIDLKGGNIVNIIEDPFEVYKTITQVSFAIPSIKVFSSLFTKDQKESFQQEIGIESKLLNNYSATDVVAHLNAKVLDWSFAQSIVDIIEYGVQQYPKDWNMGLGNRITGIFELLDMFGYWMDKETSTSNYARLWDSQHTHFASHCDYFVCNDKRARNKAKVAYSIYDCKTQMISPFE